MSVSILSVTCDSEQSGVRPRASSIIDWECTNYVPLLLHHVDPGDPDTRGRWRLDKSKNAQEIGTSAWPQATHARDRICVMGRCLGPRKGAVGSAAL